MPPTADTTSKKQPATSCGTLIIDKTGRILLCHVTGTSHWDIPKGLQDPGESTLETARRELLEETGLAFEQALFEEIGNFSYQPAKRLHLYRVQAPEHLESLAHLTCISHFVHHATGRLTPEMDGYRWARREEIDMLCAPRMAARLLALDWLSAAAACVDDLLP